MALQNGTNFTSDDLLGAQEHVWNHMFHYINSMSLKCVVDLDIPEIIHKHGKPMTLSELIDALPIEKTKSQCIYRLMRVLLKSKFFVKVNISEGEEIEGYWLTPASRLLLKDAPLSLEPLVQLILDPILAKPWHHLTEWLSNDRHTTAFETAHGQSFWGHAVESSSFNHLFNEGMASDTRLVNEVLLRDCKHVFEGFESFVDVGGGTGMTASAIADAFPDMKCVVLDLPHVVAGLEESKNLIYVVGDMFEAIPPADVVLLKWILHDWNDEESVKILKRCKDAIGGRKGRKITIIDMVLGFNNDDDTAKESQLYFDMLMMVHLTGKERSEKEWAKLFSEAGFSNYKITHALGLRSIIEVYP